MGVYILLPGSLYILLNPSLSRMYWKYSCLVFFPLRSIMGVIYRLFTLIEPYKQNQPLLLYNTTIVLAIIRLSLVCSNVKPVISWLNSSNRFPGPDTESQTTNVKQASITGLPPGLLNVIDDGDVVTRVHPLQQQRRRCTTNSHEAPCPLNQFSKWAAPMVNQMTSWPLPLCQTDLMLHVGGRYLNTSISWDFIGWWLPALITRRYWVNVMVCGFTISYNVHPGEVRHYLMQGVELESIE